MEHIRHIGDGVFEGGGLTDSTNKVKALAVKIDGKIRSLQKKNVSTCHQLDEVI